MPLILFFYCLFYGKGRTPQYLQLKQASLRNTYVQISKNSVTIYIVRTNIVAAIPFPWIKPDVSGQLFLQQQNPFALHRPLRSLIVPFSCSIYFIISVGRSVSVWLSLLLNCPPTLLLVGTLPEERAVGLGCEIEMREAVIANGESSTMLCTVNQPALLRIIALAKASLRSISSSPANHVHSIRHRQSLFNLTMAAHDVQNLRTCAAEVYLLRLLKVACTHGTGDVVD